MAEPIIINARIKQADVTQPEWVAKNPVLLLNEFYFILNEAGLAVGIIRGDGVKRLNEIPVNYFGTGTGEGWEPTLDNEPLSGSINYVNSGKLYIWGEKFVVKSGTKVLSDNNFTDALKEKLEGLSPIAATDWESLEGDPMGNTAFATIINGINLAIDARMTAAQSKDIVMQYAYPLTESGTVIYYDRYRFYGTEATPLAANLTDSISNPLYVPKVNAQGMIYLSVGSTARTLPSRFYKIAGDMVLNAVNVINYTYISSTKVDYTIRAL